jgi:hypothetical protein
MATTAIWDVKGWLGKILIYAENPEKTENPKVYDKGNLTDEQRQGLDDVIGYAMREEATTSEEIKEQFVSGVNCSPNTAREEMMAVKKRFGKDDGIVAFHGYQSFAENEVTPELAHEIGVRLANELWGDRFQVIVATHLDKQNHLHNHFVLNSVSFIDGYRYNDCTKTYMEMRKASDRLCREYGLSVIEDPKRGKAKHYGEWKAEQDGRLTWRGIIKSDIDEAIATSMTDKQFFFKLREKGYFIKRGKDITVRPEGKPRGLKLARNFGEDYTYEAICQRILANGLPLRSGHAQNKRTVKIFHFKGNIKNQRKIGGLRGRYIYYCFKLGILPKGQTISPARLHFLLREDIARMEQINKETRLLCTHKIDTSEQLFAYQESKQNKINQLTKYRTHLRYQLRRKTITPEEKEQLKQKISTLTQEIGELREEVVLCDDIAKRSEVIKEKIKIIKEDEKNKEVKNNERRGRSSRSGH